MTIVLVNGWLAALAIAVGVLGVGRITRVVVHDDFPPAAWWRAKWTDWTNDGPWSKLFTCWWCFSFWAALACVGWFLLGEVHPFFGWSWWIFWGALALSYLATMVIVRDEPKE